MAEDPRNPARVPDASPSVPPQPRRSRLAVIALILGINSLLCLMSMNVLPDFLPFVGLLTLPLSFILGVAAMIVIYASKKRLSGIWMALGGLAFALVTTFLFVLYPTIRKVHDHARANVCRGNLRQIGAACRAYASDNQDWMPDDFSALFPKYLSEAQAFSCPAHPSKWSLIERTGRVDPTNTSYVLVGGLKSSDPGVCVLAFDRDTHDRGDRSTFVLCLNGDVRREHRHSADSTLKSLLDATHEAARQRGGGIRLVGE